MNDGMIRLTRPWVIAAALAAPLVASAVLSRMRDQVTSATAALLLVLVVVAVAATGDRLAGLLAALSSAAWFDFFLTMPYNSFAIESADNVEITALLLLIGASVSELALWGRRNQERASARAGYLEGALRAAELISLHNEPPDVLAASVAEQIAAVLGVSSCRYTPGAWHDQRNALVQRDGTVTQGGRPLNVDRRGLPTMEETALQVRRGDRILGHFVVASPTRVVYPTVEQRKVAVLLADQMGAVIATD